MAWCVDVFMFMVCICFYLYLYLYLYLFFGEKCTPRSTSPLSKLAFD
tara:strand:+ start:262 stop:402 length:141 start_codon:yes stop_codon:yes gene_type:complete